MKFNTPYTPKAGKKLSLRIVTSRKVCISGLQSHIKKYGSLGGTKHREVGK
jgi:hypothetical protein